MFAQYEVAVDPIHRLVRAEHWPRGRGLGRVDVHGRLVPVLSVLGDELSLLLSAAGIAASA
jgi:hypothetical protein